MQIPLTSWAAAPMGRDRRQWQMRWWKRVEKRGGFSCCSFSPGTYSLPSPEEEWVRSCCAIASTAQSNPCTASWVPMLTSLVSTGAQYQLTFLAWEKPQWPHGKSSKAARKKVRMFFLTHRTKLGKSQVFARLLYLFFGVIGRPVSWQRRITCLGTQRARKSLQSFWHEHSCRPP